MSAGKGMGVALMLLSLVGCSRAAPAPPPPVPVLPVTLLEQLGAQVSWLKAGACSGDAAASAMLGRALAGQGMARADFAWLDGQARRTAGRTGAGMLTTPSPLSLSALSCRGPVPG